MDEFDLDAGTHEFYDDPRFYDHEFQYRRSDVWWYGEQYLDTDGPVLELAIGSGRVAVRAVRDGATVIGLDLSQSMLRRCAERRSKLPRKRQSSLHLVRGDMRNFAFNRRFDLITCPFNAFMHLYTVEDVERCLRCVKRALSPDGVFIVDVLMPDFEFLSRSPFKRYVGPRLKHPVHGSYYTYSEQSAYDPVRQLNQMWFHYDRIEAEAPGPESFVVQLSHRYFYPRELEALMHFNGLQVLQMLGDFKGGPLTGDSESIIALVGHR
ncbi:MAG: class I SAM-dependent methyltransferase [Myxococcales bacterium]|nr:class I SAM-dependent methyltransferase [Myxococcales bacterium]